MLKNELSKTEINSQQRTLKGTSVSARCAIKNSRTVQGSCSTPNVTPTGTPKCVESVGSKSHTVRL